MILAKEPRWPLLNSLIGSTELHYIDYELANQLQAPTEAVAALICHLSLAAREGHLCVCIQDTLSPSVDQLWGRDHPEIKELIIQGSHNFPDTIPIVRHGDLFYFQRYWTQETTALNDFRRLQSTPPKILLDPLSIQKQLQSAQLLPEQAEAILKAASQAFTIICGGPGTGKTYTAGILLKLLLDAYPCEIVLAAPTGKAAANLQRAMTPGLPTSRTLHSLLGLGKRSVTRKLSADIILVDECSMIDAQLMGHLLAAIKPGARVIFLGDKYQLPPVEAGSLFSEMIAAAPDCVATLSTCMRAELQEIVTFSHKIQAGDEAAVFQMLDTGTAVSRHAGDLPFERFPNLTDPVAALQAFNDFRILSPLRKGPFGVDQINRTLFSQLTTRPAVVPIMLASNDSRLQLFNGETGVLMMHGDFVQEADYALFPSKEGVRRIPALLLPNYEYAYCLSVHKSQGSEFNHVLLLMPEGAQNFGREVLYTAATRARKSLQIHGQSEVLRATLMTAGSRLSGFSKRFLVN